MSEEREPDHATPLRTVLVVNGPECGYSDGYRDGASEAEFLASADRLLGRQVRP